MPIIIIYDMRDKIGFTHKRGRGTGRDCGVDLTDSSGAIQTLTVSIRTRVVRTHRRDGISYKVQCVCSDVTQLRKRARARII